MDSTESVDTKPCPYCGEPIKLQAIKCRWCGSFLVQPPRSATSATSLQDDALARIALPVGRSGWAIASGYLALFSIIPLVGLPFAVAAIVTGVLAIRNILRDSICTGW